MAVDGGEKETPSWAPPGPGERIGGKYVVERVLGAGGMGTVLAARHVQLKSHVAIKVLSPQALKLPGAVERFLREAQAAASLRSEHVGRVMDVATLESGVPYLVMELLTGSDLQSVLRQRGRLPLEEAIDYLLQTCEAIGEAHDLGIIHRDLKPANLFVTTRLNGEPLVKVVDFGLAKVVDEGRASGDAALTATGVAAGSPYYMAPEQIRGLKLADARSDVWSIGVIAYELFTGERPFRANDAMGVLAVILTEEPARPREIEPTLPEPLERIVLRCLRKNPAERLQTVQELALLLEACLPGREVEALAADADEMTRDAATRPRISSVGVGKTVPLHKSAARAPTSLDSEVQSPSQGAQIGAGTRDQTTLTLGASEVQARTAGSVDRRWPRRLLGIAAIGAVVAAALFAGVRLGRRPPEAGHHATGAASDAAMAPTTTRIPTSSADRAGEPSGAGAASSTAAPAVSSATMITPRASATQRASDPSAVSSPGAHAGKEAGAPMPATATPSTTVAAVTASAASTPAATSFPNNPSGPPDPTPPTTSPPATSPPATSPTTRSMTTDVMDDWR